MIISSEKQETYQEILDKHQASGYLRKPFNQDQFKKTIHSILNQADPTEPATQKSSAPTSCGIYEGIFGEVDIEQVCGVVQELSNIIGGIVKPRISEFSKDITQLVHPEKDLPRGGDRTDLGLGPSRNPDGGRPFSGY